MVSRSLRPRFAPHLDEHEGGVLQGTGRGALLALLERGRELVDDVAREAGRGHRGGEHLEGHLCCEIIGGSGEAARGKMKDELPIVACDDDEK